MRPFWIEQALFNDGDLAPALQGETRADVCIVGGGLIGLWSASLEQQAAGALVIAVVEA
ncbi:FAD-dependent oxidoreductase, partial [Alcaligenes phenolicus]